MKNNETASYPLIGSAILSGMKAMMPAVMILIFAWSLSYLIEVLETGLYLSDVVMKANLPIAFLPVISLVPSLCHGIFNGNVMGLICDSLTDCRENHD